MTQFFAVAPRGTEGVLAEELLGIGISSVEERRGGVAFGEGLTEAYRACLWSRVASRVLLPIRTFQASDANALYEGVRSIDWVQHLGAEHTLAVDVAGKNAAAGPGQFVTLKVKDAIVDSVRDHECSRPNIDTSRPDVRINVYVRGTSITVNIDLSGRGLHRRGIDRAGTEAPLKENLAAAILRLAGWPAREASYPFFDPMCGSGTLLIEASWMALDVAPGVTRERLGLNKGWRGHDALLWERLREEATERTRAAASRILCVSGADSSQAAILVARANLRRAGLESRVQIERRELRMTTPPESGPGILVTNPPYGERLGDTAELGPLYESLGDVLKRCFPGWKAWIFTGSPVLAKRIGLRSSSRHVLFNGPIESRLLEIPISAGPIKSGAGPGWRRASGESKALVTRLHKNLRRLRPWATRNRLTCYRLYDADVPQYNVAIDWYDGAVRVEEYPPPGKVPQADADRRLRDTLLVVPDMLEVDPSAIVLRVGDRQRAAQTRQSTVEHHDFQVVEEGDSRFEVNLRDYWDPGLGLNDRHLRRRIRNQATGIDFLNLFARTCTASVAAALGGARSCTSVDVSDSHLAWGRRNFALNGVKLHDHYFVCSDLNRWLTLNGHRRYDLVILTLPADLRGQLAGEGVAIQGDHVSFIHRAGRLLKPSGELLLTTMQKPFALDSDELPGLGAKEITEAITTPDFEQRPRLRAWSLGRAEVDQP